MTDDKPTFKTVIKLFRECCGTNDSNPHYLGSVGDFLDFITHDLQPLIDQTLEALQEIDDWFEKLKKKQTDMLGQGLQQASENWDLATNVEILDMEKAKQVLQTWKGE